MAAAPQRTRRLGRPRHRQSRSRLVPHQGRRRLARRARRRSPPRSQPRPHVRSRLRSRHRLPALHPRRGRRLGPHRRSAALAESRQALRQELRHHRGGRRPDRPPPTPSPISLRRRCCAAVGHDKKARGGRVPFVLPTAIGKVTIVDAVEASAERAGPIELEALGASSSASTPRLADRDPAQGHLVERTPTLRSKVGPWSRWATRDDAPRHR